MNHQFMNKQILSVIVVF